MALRADQGVTAGAPTGPRDGRDGPPRVGSCPMRASGQLQRPVPEPDSALRMPPAQEQSRPGRRNATGAGVSPRARPGVP